MSTLIALIALLLGLTGNDATTADGDYVTTPIGG